MSANHKLKLDQRVLSPISLIRNNVRLILILLDVLNRVREGGSGYFTVLINSLTDAQESTLSALHAFASRGQRFERKSSAEKPKT